MQYCMQQTERMQVSVLVRTLSKHQDQAGSQLLLINTLNRETIKTPKTRLFFFCSSQKVRGNGIVI